MLQFFTSTLNYQLKSVKKIQLNILLNFNIDFDIFFLLKNRVGEKVTCFGWHAAWVAWLVKNTGMSVIICLIRESICIISYNIIFFFFIFCWGGKRVPHIYTVIELGRSIRQHIILRCI